MAGEGGKKKAPARKRKPSPGKLKRQAREKNRRMKALRAKPPGPKEKLVSGCMVSLIMLALLFLAAVTWTCIFAE